MGLEECDPETGELQKGFQDVTVVWAHSQTKLRCVVGGKPREGHGAHYTVALAFGGKGNCSSLILTYSRLCPVYVGFYFSLPGGRNILNTQGEGEWRLLQSFLPVPYVFRWHHNCHMKDLSLVLSCSCNVKSPSCLQHLCPSHRLLHGHTTLLCTHVLGQLAFIALSLLAQENRDIRGAVPLHTHVSQAPLLCISTGVHF